MVYGLVEQGSGLLVFNSAGWLDVEEAGLVMSYGLTVR